MTTTDRQALSNRITKKTKSNNDCVEWVGVRDRDGYGRMRIKTKLHQVHRIAYAIKYGPIPTGLLVLHKCDNPPCVRIDHLFVGTHKDNSDDKIAKGRYWRPLTGGERNGRAKLSLSKVADIRKKFSAGMQQAEIARSLGVPPSTVSHVVRRYSWRNV